MAVHDRLNEPDADRAARLIAEHPPEANVKLGGCCS
jgi:hypothetical protein